MSDVPAVYRSSQTKFAAALVATALAVSAASGLAAERRRAVSLDELPQAWHDDQSRDQPLDVFRGHRVVLTMAYATCHRTCPLALHEFTRMQESADERGEAIDFVVVGYDPHNDGAEVWHRYRLERRLTRANWHFLTGSPEATRQLAQQLGFPFWQYEEHVMHESRAVLFDTDGIEQAALGAPISHWANAL